MFNPFVSFHYKMIEGLRDMKRRYLVSQTNLQCTDNEVNGQTKIPLLLSDYDDLNVARVHYNALLVDKYRAILDLEKEEHRAKLSEMLDIDSKYILFSAFIEDQRTVEKQLNEIYSVNMRSYISKMTNWRIGAGNTIYPKLEMIFGELFVTLKYHSQSVRVKLSELEKY